MFWQSEQWLCKAGLPAMLPAIRHFVVECHDWLFLISTPPYLRGDFEFRGRGHPYQCTHGFGGCLASRSHLLVKSIDECSFVALVFLSPQFNLSLSGHLSPYFRHLKANTRNHVQTNHPLLPPILDI